MLVYVECECFVMQTLYVCVLCASCGSSQCCVLHDLQFVNAGRGSNRRAYRRGILQSRCSSLDYTPTRLYPGLNWASLEYTPGVILG